MKIESLVLLGIVVAVLYYVVRWVKEAKVTADPWEADIDANVHQPDALPICHRCLTPQERTTTHWFCAVCDAAVGPYNNYLPYIRIFSEGEVLRAGTTGAVQPGFLIVAGYLLYSILCYSIFAPVYWYLLLKNLKPAAPNQNGSGALEEI